MRVRISIDAEYEFDDDNDGNVSDDETDISDSGEEDGVHVEEVDASKAQSDGQLGKSFEDDEDDDGDINSEIGRSDILVSPVPSDEDDGSHLSLMIMTSMQWTYKIHT
ncbi:hypothetical protein SLA2020_399420 [Shorea laevis]